MPTRHAFNWKLLLSVLLGLGVLVRCEQKPAPSPVPVQRAAAKSLLTVDASAERERLDAPYRLKLDARVPRGFRAVHQMLTAGVQADFHSTSEKKHRYVYRDQTKLAELSEAPELAESKAAILKYAEFLGPLIVRAPEAPLSASAATETPWLEPIESSFQRLNSVAGLRASELLGRDVAPRVARALVNLCFQATDRLGTADDVCARALTLLAIAEKVSGVSLAEPAALLSYTMGYEAEAERLSEVLGAEHPLRAFVTRNDAVLRRLATANAPSFATRLLWLVRLNEAGKADEEASYRGQYFRGAELTASVLCARLRGKEGALQPEFVAALPSLLLLEANGLTRDPQALRFRTEIRSSSARPEELTEVGVAIERLFAPNTSVFVAYETVTERLSARAGAADALSSAATRSFLSTLMFSALRARALSVGENPSGKAALVESLRRQKLGVFEEFSRWLNVASGPKVAGRAPELLAQAQKLREIGGVGWEPLYVALAAGVRPGSASQYALAQAFFSHLDSRPRYRWMAANVAGEALSDALLREQFLRVAVDAAPNAYPQQNIGLSGFLQDEKRLIALSQVPSWTLADRAHAVLELSRVEGVPAGALDENFRKLLSKTEDDWAARSVYVDFLRTRGQLDVALEVTREWLFPEPRSGAESLIAARTRAASILMEQGKLPEAWKLVEPLVDSLQSAPLQVASQILVRQKNVERAVALVEADVQRGSNAQSSQANYVDLLWRAARYDAAAKMLAEAQSQPSFDILLIDVSQRFSAMLGRDAEATKLAFDALRDAKLSPPRLARFAESVAKTHPELGFELFSRITAVGPEQLGNLLRAYIVLKKQKGEGAAVSWISEKVPQKSRQNLAELAFLQGQNELLWEFAEPTGRPLTESDFVWVLRAASLVRAQKTSDPKWKRVVGYFTPDTERKAPGLSLLLGRYLVGGMDAEALVKLAVSPQNAARVAYYLGLMAQAKAKLEVAHTWYRVAAESGLTDLPECRLAKAQLDVWRDSGRALKFQH